MKKKLTEEEFIDMWLVPYHNITLKGVEEAHPNWLTEPEKHTRDFYRTYAVTQEQHDEWYDKAIERVMKHFKLSKKRAKKDFAIAYLNVAPSVKGDIIT